MRAIGGAPTCVLTDNEKTMTIDRVAGIAVRHPQVVAAGRHYGLQVHTCVPFDPESTGGSEATVRTEFGRPSGCWPVGIPSPVRAAPLPWSGCAVRCCCSLPASAAGGC
ncbi:hypothetical protein RKD23_000104 [Streptomyces sp. SAI-170]